MTTPSDATPSAENQAHWPPIVKRSPSGDWVPNLRDYDGAWAEFSWGEARRRLDGLPGGKGLNIAHEAVDRHTAVLHGNRLALRWISRTGVRRDFTYDDLRDATNRFANVLKRLGVGRGDVVATLAGRIPSLYIAALGTLKNGSVHTPLFSAFGPDPIVSRMTIARARMLVTTDTLYRKKVEPVRARMPDLEHVLLVRDTTAPLPPATLEFNELLDAASGEFTIRATDPQDHERDRVRGAAQVAGVQQNASTAVSMLLIACVMSAVTRFRGSGFQGSDAAHFFVATVLLSSATMRSAGIPFNDRL